ncbi:MULTISPECIES: hypothetical protein [Shewanella]|uniref:hypothetical protein n=1 Tax=Shewanella sp. 8A TaxID=2943323 RepID=UPI00201A4165|nr:MULTISPECIES: hypothetical protein [Shewanella]MDL3987311.1 hypothetical protein [Shewanella xiamenensis]
MLTHQIGVVAQLLAQQIPILHYGGNKALLHQLKTQQSEFGGLEFEIFSHLSHPHGRGLQRQPRGQALPTLLRLAIEDNPVIRQLQQSAAQHHLSILAEAIEHLIGQLVG